jgi:hypothetical protein
VSCNGFNGKATALPVTIQDASNATAYKRIGLSYGLSACLHHLGNEKHGEEQNGSERFKKKRSHLL